MLYRERIKNYPNLIEDKKVKEELKNVEFLTANLETATRNLDGLIQAIQKDCMHVYAENSTTCKLCGFEKE